MADDSAIVKRFLAATRSEDPKLGKGLDKLDDEAHLALATVLRCFDTAGAGELDEEDRALARRVLSKLHRPSPRGLEQLAAALACLGGGSQALGRNELALAVEILELFCKADSVNDTLSQKELDMLLAVLEHVDADGNGVLSPEERARLRDQLWDADAFLAEQKQTNPRLRKLID
jgi:hypothetical protein